MVERDRIIDGSSITVGNRLIGLASSGLHSNGYSLARKMILDIMGLGINDVIPGLDQTVADELLTPTRIYVKSHPEPAARLHHQRHRPHHRRRPAGKCPPRAPPRLQGSHRPEQLAGYRPSSTLLQQGGNIDENEMFRTFNCGIGMVLAVPESEADEILIRLSGLNEQAHVIGEVVKCEAGRECVELV